MGDNLLTLEEAQVPPEGEEEQPKGKWRKVVPTTQELPDYSEAYFDKEVLQLLPVEALFLTHLNLLIVTYNNCLLSLSQFLYLVAMTSWPGDPFLVHFIVYYHYCH